MEASFHVGQRRIYKQVNKHQGEEWRMTGKDSLPESFACTPRGRMETPGWTHLNGPVMSVGRGPADDVSDKQRTPEFRIARACGMSFQRARKDSEGYLNTCHCFVVNADSTWSLVG